MMTGWVLYQLILNLIHGLFISSDSVILNVKSVQTVFWTHWKFWIFSGKSFVWWKGRKSWQSHGEIWSNWRESLSYLIGTLTPNGVNLNRKLHNLVICRLVRISIPIDTVWKCLLNCILKCRFENGFRSYFKFFFLFFSRVYIA